jgi:hypothetical protein
MISGRGMNGWTGEARDMFEARLWEIEATGGVRSRLKLASGRRSPP